MIPIEQIYRAFDQLQDEYRILDEANRILHKDIQMLLKANRELRKFRAETILKEES